MNSSAPHVHGNQIRAARGLLGWERVDLARESGIGVTALSDIENGRTEKPNKRTVAAIQGAFLKHGVQFTLNGGVEPIKPDLRTYSGSSGFRLFFDDIYETIKGNGGEIIITGVVDQQFVDALDDVEFLRMHISRMANLENFTMRCLTEEGDTSAISSEYCEYRWSPRKRFSPVPFYIYSDKVAFIQFNVPNEGTIVIVIQSKLIADAFRLQFDGMWEDAKISA